MFPWIVTVIIPNVVFAPFWDYAPITDWSRDLAATTADLMTSVTQAMLAAQQNFGLAAIGMVHRDAADTIASKLATHQIPTFDGIRQRKVTSTTMTKRR